MSNGSAPSRRNGRAFVVLLLMQFLDESEFRYKSSRTTPPLKIIMKGTKLSNVDSQVNHVISIYLDMYKYGIF